MPVRRDAVVPTDRGERDQQADKGGGRSREKFCSAVADAVTGRPRCTRMASLELTFAPKDVSGEGDTSMEHIMSQKMDDKHVKAQVQKCHVPRKSPHGPIS